MDERKISIIGAGQVGSQAAACCLDRRLGSLVLVDIQPGLAHGRALDLLQAQAVRGGPRIAIEGTADYAVTAGSDIVVITAGQARKPGMTRGDLLASNARILVEAIQQAVHWSPHCILVIVTNPINTLVKLALELSGFPPERVIGMAGTLDNARLRWSLAEMLQVGTDAITSWVIGDHGDHMVALLSQTTVHGVPVRQCLTSVQLEQAVSRARQGGTEIVEALRTGSASHAPGRAIAELLSGLLNNEASLHCCSCFLQGEYGVSGVYAGMVTQLNQTGVQKIIEFPLEASERRRFHLAIDQIQARNAQLTEQGPFGWPSLGNNPSTSGS